MSEPAQTTTTRKTISGGRLLLIVGVLWIVALTGVYFVVVQLKLGGERGIRLPEDTDASQVDPGGE